MVKGLERFHQHFSGYEASFVLIGGVAADMWLTRAGLPFRVTKDIDTVLLLDALDDAFLRRVWDFVRAGGYRRRERADGRRTYYRFSSPADGDYPKMLEFFSRTPDGLAVPGDQSVVPIPAVEDASSLSAILMDDDYYRLVSENRELVDGLPYVSPPCLILLKACAWCDLTDRRAAGGSVDEKDIKKHRNDVFRLALLLARDTRIAVPDKVLRDLTRLLDAFPPGAKEWPSIEQSLRMGERWPGAEVVLSSLRECFAAKRG